MMPNYTNSSAQSNGTAATVRAASPCYLAAPELTDVLYEQMDYLLAHAGHNTAGCADCARLAKVVRVLMQPFE